MDRVVLRRASDGLAQEVRQNLEAIERLTPKEAGKLKPAVTEELKVDLHHHFVPSTNPAKRAKQVRAFWKAVQASDLDAVAVTTHSDIERGDVNPESIYRELREAMPEKLRKGKFKLLAGLEVQCRPNKTEIGLISPEPDLLYKDPFWYSMPSADDVGRKIRDDSRLLGYLPHPFSGSGGAAHGSHMGADEARRLVGEYGLGVEFTGMYRDGKLLTQQPILRQLLGLFEMLPQKNKVLTKIAAVSEGFRRADEEVHRSGLAGEARFVTVGGDYHDAKDLGKSYILVPVKKKSDKPLSQQYDILESGGGMILLEASKSAVSDAAGRPASEEEIIESIKTTKDTAEPHLQGEQGKDFKLLLNLTAEFARETKANLREKRLVKKQE
ncbi:MAG: hypothetical protein V1921_03660 [Candidatus Altiarchaeota archaeon]